MLYGQSLCVCCIEKIVEEQFLLSKLLGTCFGGHILLASMTQNLFKCSIGILVLVYCHRFFFSSFDPISIDPFSSLKFILTYLYLHFSREFEAAYRKYMLYYKVKISKWRHRYAVKIGYRNNAANWPKQRVS